MSATVKDWLAMAEVLQWRGDADSQPLAEQAARALADGKIVAFPTETVYGIAANPWIPEAVERLCQGKGRAQTKPLALAVSGLAEALEWVPGLGSVGRRLARRTWPGPLTLVSGDGVADGLASRLDERVRQRVCPTGTIGLRNPAHEAILQALRTLQGPLVLTSANRSGEPDAVTGEAVLDAVGDQIDLAIVDGKCSLGHPSTVVRIDGDNWKLLREGAIPASDLAGLTGRVVLFLCTGNTCRSPLAEALCKKMLAERLQCSVDELPSKGFTIGSAGLAALPGASAASDAVEIAREMRADLSQHKSRLLTSDLAHQADFLIAMTGSHVCALGDYLADLGVRIRLLSSDEDDIPDPIGADRETYRECARLIESQLEKLLPEVLAL